MCLYFFKTFFDIKVCIQQRYKFSAEAGTGPIVEIKTSPQLYPALAQSFLTILETMSAASPMTLLQFFMKLAATLEINFEGVEKILAHSIILYSSPSSPLQSFISSGRFWKRVHESQIPLTIDFIDPLVVSLMID